MTAGYSATKEGYDKKNLSEKQKALLENLQKSEDGDAVQAAIDAGYSNPYQAIRQNAELIKDLVEDELAKLSMESAKMIGKVIRSAAGVPQASDKLKAAALVLERTNPKTDHINVGGEVKSSIFVLPNKKPLDEVPNEQD
jgi:hypothetical protein